MTDSEKLDLLLTEMQGINQKVDKLASEVDKLTSEQAEIRKKVDKLALEQTRTQNELYKISRKIEDTYGVALDALAATAENRKWLATGSGTLI